MTKGELIALWEDHLKHKFQTHDTEATLNTMVVDSGVNHIPDGVPFYLSIEIYSYDW